MRLAHAERRLLAMIASYIIKQYERAVVFTSGR
jgi:hypothetical protein